ncbi:hypothetical protein ACE0DR_06250 [Azotobacter sp. CWF10]
MSTNKQQRLEHCNQLLQVIARHGRRFFYSADHDRVAILDLDARGRVWFIDDYSGKRVYTHPTGFGSRWRGFTHGGTLRSLVEALRDYIVTGEPMPRGYIAPERTWTDGDIWGYGPEAAKAVREEAYAIPMFRDPQKQEAA